MAGLGPGDGGHQRGVTEADHGHPGVEAAEVTEARMEDGAEDEGEVEAVWGHPGACVPLHHGLWVVTDNKYSFYVTKVRWHQAPGGNCSVSVTAG